MVNGILEKSNQKQYSQNQGRRQLSEIRGAKLKSGGHS